jgi:imidazole glycerol-phosphate synthase subunit HisF
MIKRIIARLDIKGPNLVKGIHLEGLRVLGKPENFAQYYYETGADELFYQDIVASLYERNSLEAIIRKTAQNIFIPFTVGGGIRTIDDVRFVLRNGADKISINTAALKNGNIIKEISRAFGTSTIVVAIEAIRQNDGRHLAFTDNGREYTGMEVLDWVKKVEDLGAGEILLTSVDREGTGLGFDLDLIGKVTDMISVPLIVHGGAGNVQHVIEVLKNEKVSAVALASILHYEYLKYSREKDDIFIEGNLDFLKSDRVFSKINFINIKELKKKLVEHGIDCRNELMRVVEK